MTSLALRTARRVAARAARPFISLPSLSRVERTFEQRKVVPFSRQQLFDVVTDVDKYSHFVPFCVASRVTRRLTPRAFEAELAVGFQLLRESYLSQVTAVSPESVTVASGPSRIFDWLTCSWRFKEGSQPSSCAVEFTVRFASSSPMYGPLLERCFAEVAERQICAFEARCRLVYGSQQNRLRNAPPTPGL